MCRKLFLLILVLGLAASASAQINYTWVGGISPRWTKAGNWDLGIVPGASDTADIRPGSVADPIIHAGTPLPYDTALNRHIDIFFINSGIVHVKSGGYLHSRRGYAGNTGATYGFTGTARLRVCEGTVTTNDDFQVGRREDGLVELLHESALFDIGGKFRVGGSKNSETSTGFVHLYAGTITCGTFLPYDDNPVTGDPGARIDIRAGQLIIDSDPNNAVGVVSDAVLAGRIGAYGRYYGDCGFGTVFDITVEEVAGVVTVTAVPEPATIALLGLGGLVLFRRKRRL